MKAKDILMHSDRQKALFGVDLEFVSPDPWPFLLLVFFSCGYYMYIRY
jgi:hypothetical protein